MLRNNAVFMMNLMRLKFAYFKFLILENIKFYSIFEKKILHH
jgi:hypothetical protein